MDKEKLTGYIIAYEENKLSFDKCLELHAYLIKTGMAYNLQGHYGRIANALIEQGYISKDGKITFYNKTIEKL